MSVCETHRRHHLIVELVPDDVGDFDSRNWFDNGYRGVATCLLLVLYQLLKEPNIRADDVSGSLDGFVGVVEGFLLKLHHVGDAKRGASGDAHCAEQKRAACFFTSFFDLIMDQFEVRADVGGLVVLEGNLDDLHVVRGDQSEARDEVYRHAES